MNLIAVLLEKIQASRPSWKPANKAQALQEWEFSLRDIPPADLVAAVDRYCRSTDEWPAPGKVAELALEVAAERQNGGPLPTASEAWDRCLRVAREYHPYCDPREHAARKAKLTPAEEGAYRTVHMDGYHELTDDAGRATMQKRFLEAYADRLRKPHRERDFQMAASVLQIPEVQRLLGTMDPLKAFGPGYADDEDPRPPRQLDEG